MNIENPNAISENARLVQQEEEAWTNFLGKKIEV